MIKKYTCANHISFTNLLIILVVIVLTLISGCSFSSTSADTAFDEKYSAAQKKYEKYLQEPVNGREVLELIENWNETDFDLTVEDSEGGRYCVSGLDKSNTIYKYWDEESIYFIEPDALYKGSFILYQSPRKKNTKDIEELYFSKED